MPRAPHPLPESLGEVFSGHDLTAAGVSLGRMRRADLDDRIRGVRAAAGAADDLVMRCRMLQHRLGPSTFFSHATAALLLGAPIPWQLEREALHVTVAAPHRAPHAAGILGHSRQILPGDVVETRGVRHSSPARMWCELGSRLAVPDLVAVADHLIHHRRGAAAFDDLAFRLEGGDRIARSRRLRPSLALVDDHAESAQESRLRVLLALGGLPAPRVNRVVVATEQGARYRPDFTFAVERVILEYQGDYHRTKAQWRADMTRRTRLEATGWRVVELNADDLGNPVELCARVRRLLARGPR